MEKRNTILLTVIAIATLLVAVVGATFAYFASTINTEANVGVNINTAKNKAVFLSSASSDINIKVDAYMMQEQDATTDNNVTSNNTEIANDLVGTANLNVSLTAAESGQVTKCTYDIVWEWDSDSSDFTSGAPDAVTTAKGKVNSEEQIYPTKYYIRSEQVADPDGKYTAAFKEFTIDGTQTVSGSETSSHSSGDMFGEKNIDTFAYSPSSSDQKMILKSGEVIATDGTATISYDFEIKFYNLSSDQSSLMGKNFKAHINIENVVC